MLSQTFDQAQKQAEIEGNDRPESVSVWVLSPFRVVFDRQNWSFLRDVQKRCPNVSIRSFYGINRFNNFPLKRLLKSALRRHRLPVVFHFRTEASVIRFSSNSSKRSSDRYIVDVRGYWPAELLYSAGIDDPGADGISSRLMNFYSQAKRNLRQALSLSDGVITVSVNLASLLRNKFDLGDKPIQVVPCCVSRIDDGSRRISIRKEMGVEANEKLLAYSGGYARYQHLEDMVIPFFKILLEKDEKIRVLILSHALEKIKPIVDAHNLPRRVLFMEASQEDVAAYLSGCDLGFLIRKPTLVNTVAQPVKVAEYLAAGVPVCVEGEVGGVTEKLVALSAGLSVNISGQEEDWDHAAERVLAFLSENNDSRQNARILARDYFLWESNILRQRNFYREILTHVWSNGDSE